MDQRVEVDGHVLKLSNLDKVLYPGSGFTKGEVLDYYTRISPLILPHLRDRPTTRKRWPEGVQAPLFFEKNVPRGTPDWVRTVRLDSPGSSKDRDTVVYPLVDDLATLLWCVNLAALELHVHQWRVGPRGARRSPDRLVVDLDPGAPAGLAECVEVALAARDRLAADGLTAYPVTSGSKGLQLYAPISGRQEAEVVRDYAHRVARDLERSLPDLVVSRMTKTLREGKVLVDWSQNHPAKTTVCPYSLRGLADPTVAAPYSWKELEAGEVRQLRCDEVLERTADGQDPLEPLFAAGPKVPA